MANIRRNVKPSGVNRAIVVRGRWALLVIFAMMFAMCLRFGYLQLIDPNDYRSDAQGQYPSSVSIAAKRGSIYANDGTTELAVSATVYNCFISPHHIQVLANDSAGTSNPKTFNDVLDQVASGLSEILHVEKSVIENKGQNRDSQYQMIKKFLTEYEEEAVRTFITENDFETIVNLEETTRRYYRYGSFASHLIGYTGTDNQGLAGIELSYNEYLSGVNGKSVKAVDGYGNELDSGLMSTYIPATDGLNVVSTIDWAIQSSVEKYVLQAYEEHKPNGRVECIVMDVDNGEILASAIYPNFDLNSYNTLSDVYQNEYDLFIGTEEERAAYKTDLLYKMWNNTIATQTYEPGSTFKIITSAIALEVGAIDSETTSFNCNGWMDVAGTTIHCHKTIGHGMQNFSEAIVNSCNPAFMQMGKAINASRFQKYFEEFGYTQITGSDMLGEASSIYYGNTGAQFEAVELATYSFGQTFKVTPIQHLRAMSTVANGGYLVYPHTVKSLVDNDGNVVKTFKYETARQVVSSSTCDVILKSLINSTKNASVNGYNVVSKTGTSEKRDTAREDDYVSSCVTFAPAEDPQIAILVLVDEPTMGQYYGSAVAAPVVGNVLSEVLPHLGISPNAGEQTTVTVPSYNGKSVEEAKSSVEETLGVKCIVRGDGDIVVTQLPANGTVISDNGVVILYTDGAEIEANATVPNVIGMSPSKAIKTIVDSNLNVSVKGIFNGDYNNCKANAQSIPSGTQVLPGTVIEIEFLYDEEIE